MKQHYKLLICLSLLIDSTSSFALSEQETNELLKNSPPTITKSGGPEVLIAVSKNELNTYFPAGMPRDVFIKKYGNPQSSEKLNAPDSGLLDKYAFTKESTKWTGNGYEFFVVKHTSELHIKYDSSDALIGADLISSENLYTQTSGNGGAKISRPATEEEIENYLGRSIIALNEAIEKQAASQKSALSAAKKPSEKPAVAKENAQDTGNAESKKWTLGLRLDDHMVKDVKKGALVLMVNPDGLADKAGVKKGDVITHLNDQVVSDKFDVANYLQSTSTDKQLVLKVISSGKVKLITIKPTVQSPII